MKMIAHYDDYNEDFRVDLWEESKGSFYIWITSTVTFWTPSSEKRLCQRSTDMSGTVFWMVLLIVWPSGSLCSNNGAEEEVVGAKGHRFARFCAPVAGCQHSPPLRNVTRGFPAPLR
jgi:hypothetical protein